MRVKLPRYLDIDLDGNLIDKCFRCAEDDSSVDIFAYSRQVDRDTNVRQKPEMSLLPSDSESIDVSLRVRVGSRPTLTNHVVRR